MFIASSKEISGYGEDRCLAEAETMVHGIIYHVVNVDVPGSEGSCETIVRDWGHQEKPEILIFDNELKIRCYGHNQWFHAIF